MQHTQKGKMLQCPYNWGEEPCFSKFKTEEELKAHKIKRDDHEYCEKCDIDFKSWAEHVEHRASSSEKVHITCGLCGLDFASGIGRQKHIAQVSRSDRE
jgi:hypothetical protein